MARRVRFDREDMKMKDYPHQTGMKAGGLHWPGAVCILKAIICEETYSDLLKTCPTGVVMTDLAVHAWAGILTYASANCPDICLTP